VVEGELLDSLVDLRAIAPEWDALAVTASNSADVPAWVLSWLRHVARTDLDLRVVAVRDRGDLVGVVPLYLAERRHGVTEYRLMASDFGVCLEPLALPGREWDVAAAVGEVLADSRPPPDIVGFGPMSLASHWTTALKASWPGPLPCIARRYEVRGAPVIVLRDPTFEDWFGSLSAKMRSNIRRGERRFERAGGTSRWSTAETLRSDAEAFARLHMARWRGRGWSRLADLGPRLADWLEDLGRQLIEQGRFRMCVLEVDGSPICVDFHLLAGEELSAVNVGWDERYASLAPARLAAVRLVEGACAWGARRLNLGRGELANKVALANGNDPVACAMVMPPSARLPGAYARALPVLLREHMREIAERVMPAERLEAIRAIRRQGTLRALGERAFARSASPPQPMPRVLTQEARNESRVVARVAPPQASGLAR
jgi:CelD/BcsL family acetyltransferase involved in cellulose biosynthesis